jgi:hypothetical protein
LRWVKRPRSGLNPVISQGPSNSQLKHRAGVIHIKIELLLTLHQPSLTLSRGDACIRISALYNLILQAFWLKNALEHWYNKATQTYRNAATTALFWSAAPKICCSLIFCGHGY